MKLQTLNQYLAEARSNKKQRAKVSHYKIIRNGKMYSALIVDAWDDEEKGEIIVCFIVFISPKGIKREVKFKTNGAGVYYYEELCETVGTDGNPCDLIGKAVYLHFEKNGDFQNVRVDELISREELQEALAEMDEDEEERPRKKSKGGKTSQGGTQKSYKKRNSRKYEDDFDEEEDADDDFGEDADIDTDFASDYDDDFSDFD